jgi:sugar phosphate isomerase/epimerase
MRRKKQLAKWNVGFVPYYMTAPAIWRSPPTDEAIRVLKKAGYDGVEWMLGNHFRNTKELGQLVAKTRKAKLAVSNIMCWQDLVKENQAARSKSVNLLSEMIDAADDLSVPLMNVFTGPMTWNPGAARLGKEISEGKAWSLVINSFSKIIEEAEKRQVIVTVEPVFGMLVHDYYTLKELLSHFDSKYLGVNFDPSHFVIHGNDVLWSAKMLGKKIRHVHVKDAFGKPGGLGETFVFPFLGEGLVDWKGFFTILKELDYKGFLSLEFENDSYLNNVCDGDWRKAAVQLRERVAKFLPHR